MVTYGGDEVSAVVLDVGTSTTRAGYAGEDAPRTVLPTAYGLVQGSEGAESQYYIGDAAGPGAYRAGQSVHKPVKEGVIEDWPAVERIVEAGLRDQMRLGSLEEHPLLISEPSWQSKENRERWTELAFEGWGAPAFYSVDKNVLTSFAVGKGTALVLDVGEDVASCMPIYDGFVIRKGIQKSPLAGSLLTNYVASSLRSAQPPIEIRPQYLVKDKIQVAPNTPARATLREDRLEGATESFSRYAQDQVIHNFKESILQVYEGPLDENHANQRPGRSFEFPDGFNTHFGSLRYRIPEAMFNPQAFLPAEFLSSTSIVTSSASSTILTPALSQAQPLQNLVLNALRANDVDLHPTLLQNIVVVGGTTLLPGFLDRLNMELTRAAPANAKPKIEAPGNIVARKYSSWLGGSILASLGTFHQLWIGREEYQEYGKSVVHRRAK